MFGINAYCNKKRECKVEFDDNLVVLHYKNRKIKRLDNEELKERIRAKRKKWKLNS